MEPQTGVPSLPMPCASILVVEDEASIRDTLKLALELEGYTVFTASNGEEGLEALRRLPRPCLVLLDLMMPVMNGWEFVEALEADTVLAPIPVALVTAYGERGQGLHTKAIIKKPIDLELLLKVVKEFCG